MRFFGSKSGLKRKISGQLAVLLVLNGFLFSLAPIPAVPTAQAIIANGMPAIDEIGQYRTDSSQMNPIFSSAGANNSPNHLSFSLTLQRSLAIDTVRHRMFLTDFASNRVLVFLLDPSNLLADRLPDLVLGQPDFFTGTAAATQSGLSGPGGAAYDASNDRLFVADGSNNRVLVYELAGGLTNGMNASYVLGQPNFTSSASAATQSGMGSPRHVIYDAAGQRLFVVESGFHRITVFDLSGGLTNGMNASYVLGQPNFTTSTANTQNAGQGCVTTTNACGLSIPRGGDYDAATSRLFIGESTNNRVSVFDLSGGITNGMSASWVIGQPNLTSSASATTQAGLGAVAGVVYAGASQRLYAGDTTGSRVTVYDLSGGITNGMNAANALGQPDF